MNIGMRNDRLRGVTAALMIAIAVAIAGCGGDTGNSPPPAPPLPSCPATIGTGPFLGAGVGTFPVNPFVVIVGGLDQNGNSLKTTDIFNPATGLFTQGCSLSVARAGHQAELVLFPPPGPPPAGSNPSSRFDVSSNSLLIAGGVDVSNGVVTPLASAEQLDSTGQFVDTTPMSQSRVNFTLTDYGATTLAAGGDSDTGVALATDDIFGAIGLPNGGFFNNPNPMTEARAYQAATAFGNNEVLITGGVGARGIVHSSAEVFDSAASTFAATAGPMNVARYDHTATTLFAGTVLIAGGFNATGTATNTAELFDPISGTFKLVGNMTSARAGHAATLLGDGTVLITGGYVTPGTPTNTAELYNPATETFAAVGNMTAARASHTATPFGGGMVLIAGGFGLPGGSSSGSLSSLTGFLAEVGSSLSSAEIYNSATQTFSPTAGAMTSARAEQTATFY